MKGRFVWTSWCRITASTEQARRGVANIGNLFRPPLLQGNLLALDEALTKLAPCQAQLIELRFFGGLSVAEAAKEMGMPKRSAEREWAMIRAWLRRELSPSEGT